MASVLQTNELVCSVPVDFVLYRFGTWYFLCEFPETDFLDTLMHKKMRVYIMLALCVNYIILAKQTYLWKDDWYY
jgi:hypothetical protein